MTRKPNIKMYVGNLELRCKNETMVITIYDPLEGTSANLKKKFVVSKFKQSKGK